jgi:iron complex outermembrane receptor protein
MPFADSLVFHAGRAWRRRGLKPMCHIVGAAAALLCAAAWAQQGPPPDLAVASASQLANLPLTTLLDMEVTGAARFPQRESETAAAVTVVTADDIRALGYRTLADVLASMRGLMIADDRSYSYVGVRGFFAPGDYNTRVLLLIDGNRSNDNVYDQAYLGDEFPLDLDLVERIEFIPGQGSAVYGANALFGVINVITKRPGAPGTKGAYAAAGSGDTKQLRVADVHELPDGTTLQWSASRALMAGVDTAQTSPGAPDTAASTGTDYERRSSVYLRALHGDWTATALHAERIKGAPILPGAVWGDPRTSNRDEHSMLDLTWQHALDPHTDLTARWFVGHYLFVGRYAWDYPPVTINEDLVTGQWWGLEARAFSTRFAGHKLMLGVDYQDNTHLRQANFDLDAAHTSYLDDRRSSWRGALSAEDQMALSPQLDFTAGGRWDHSSGYGGQFSPRLALVWHPEAAWVGKLIYGSAYRTPNAYEAYYHVDTNPGGYKLNPQISSETVRGTELALQWQPDASDRFNASVYENRASGLLLLTVDPADQMLVFRNAGSARTRGIELEAEHLWPGGAKLRANLSLQGSPVQTGADLTDDAPRRMLKLMQTVPVGHGWNLGAEWQAVSRRDAAAGYGKANLTLSTPLAAHGWSFSASVFDLLDRQPDDPGPDLINQPTVQQRGRSALLRVEYGF